MQDVDRVLAEIAEQAASIGLDLDTVREVLIAHMLREQPLPVGPRKTSVPAPAVPPHGFFPE
jgi:hypothetical protein